MAKKEKPQGKANEETEKPTNQQIIEGFLNRNYEFKLNEITKECFCREIPENTNFECSFEPVNFDNIIRKIGNKYSFKYGISQLQSLLRSDFVPRYNPFKDWFNNLPIWDGKDYIKALCDCIILSSDKYNDNGKIVEQNLSERVRLETMIKKWLVRALRCLMGGAINREVLMFFSLEQRIGKSKFFEYLVPNALKDFSLVNPKIKGVGNNELYAPLARNFIINFDEYDTLIYDGCIPALKSYISSEDAAYRTLYTTTWVHEQRICSFVASTNIPDFLRDETGNSRYICFDIQKFDYQIYMQTDVNFIWSQAKYLLENKFDCDMTKQELTENNENNIKYLYHSTEYELISKIYEPSVNDDDFKTATEIAQELKDKHFNITPQKVGRAMTALKIKRVHSKRDNRQMGYYIRQKDSF